MKRSFLFVALSTMAFVGAGCVANRLGADRQDVRVRGSLPGDVPELLASATTFVVYEIDPNDQEEMLFDVPSNARGTTEEPRICGYRVVKFSQVSDPTLRLAIAKELMKDIVHQDGTLFCFSPRHAIYAANEDGYDVNLLICYSCSSIRVYSTWGRTQSAIAKSSRARLDRVLSN